MKQGGHYSSLECFERACPLIQHDCRRDGSDLLGDFVPCTYHRFYAGPQPVSILALGRHAGILLHAMKSLYLRLESERPGSPALRTRPSRALNPWLGIPMMPSDAPAPDSSLRIAGIDRSISAKSSESCDFPASLRMAPMLLGVKNAFFLEKGVAKPILMASFASKPSIDPSDSSDPCNLPMSRTLIRTWRDPSGSAQRPWCLVAWKRKL